MTQQLQEMITTNERQREFYDKPFEERAGGSLATSAWFTLHDRIGRAWTAAGIADDLVRLQQEWAGDPAGRRVLDLGCMDGTTMTWWLAERAGAFTAIDLSAACIARVQKRIAHLPNARAISVDFLSPDFPERDFDLVNATSVLHHFRHLDQMLDILADRLVPGGRVITYDPLQTALSVRLVRALYRRWQVDSDWEWPFTAETFRTIERRFRIVELRGVYGVAKWALPLAVIAPKHGARLLRRLYDRDIRTATRQDRALWRCMHVMLLLEKR